MKVLRVFGILAMVAGLIGIPISYLVETNYSGRAKLIQRIESNPGADLFGDAGTPIGSPQKLIIDDPKAFVGEKSADGAELVDEAYLKEHSIYPLQLQTVSYVTRISRWAALAALIIGALVWLFAGSRIKRRATSRQLEAT